MNLRSVDLNLLVVLDALLTERNVSRAGQRIGLSQSAMSAALSRLRDLFGDPLLIRVGRELAQRRIPKGIFGQQLALVQQDLDATTVCNHVRDGTRSALGKPGCAVIGTR